MKTQQIDYNSTANQTVKNNLVQREVVACASQMVYELNNSDDFRDEVLEKFYSHMDYEQEFENWLYDASKDDKADLCDYLGIELDSIEDADPEEACNYLNLYPDYIEPLEFWIVTDYFGEKLKKHGQIVAEFMGFTIWGRLTSGQAILLDYVISKIAEGMEILEHQENHKYWL